MKPPIVIYHGGCYDGFTAAWIARQAMPGCELHEGRYGEPPPDVTGREAYVLDFSYPRDTMIQMERDALSLVVLDHHKTAEADCAGLDFCHFDMERSGAGMAWDWFMSAGREGDGRPEWIDSVEDRDLWRFTYPWTAAVHAYMASRPMTMEEWSEIDEMTLRELEAAGQSILQYIDTWCERAAAEARTVWIGTQRAVVVNVPYQNASEMGHRLLQSRGKMVHFAAGYFQRADGRWQFSLRSDDDHADVSEVAKRYGGGGHRNAAGFDVAALDEVIR